MKINVYVEDVDETYTIENVRAQDSVGDLRQKISNVLAEEGMEDEDAEADAFDLDKSFLVFEEKILPQDEDHVDWSLLSKCLAVKLVTHIVMEDSVPRRKRTLEAEDLKWVLKRERIMEDDRMLLEDLDIKPNDHLIIRSEAKQNEERERTGQAFSYIVTVHVPDLDKDVDVNQNTATTQRIRTYGELRQHVWDLISSPDPDPTVVRTAIKDVWSIMDMDELRQYCQNLQADLVMLRNAFAEQQPLTSSFQENKVVESAAVAPPETGTSSAP